MKDFMDRLCVIDDDALIDLYVMIGNSLDSLNALGIHDGDVYNAILDKYTAVTDQLNMRFDLDDFD